MKRLWQTIILQRRFWLPKNVQERTRQSGKGIGSMSPEKKAFFNKIDKKYSAKDEGMETMVPNKKDDPKDMKRKQTMTNQKATKVEMEPKVEYDK